MASWSIEPDLREINIAGPTVLQLGFGFLALVPDMDVPPKPQDWLSPADHDRFVCFEHPDVAVAFAAGRYALLLASKALGHDTRSYVILDGPAGYKPQFGPEAKGLTFNISHTPGLAICLAAQSTDVGCDCERTDRTVDTTALIETLGLKGLHAPNALLAWTRFEAMLKLTGRGLNQWFPNDGNERTLEPVVDQIWPRLVGIKTLLINQSFYASYCHTHMSPPVNVAVPPDQ